MKIVLVIILVIIGSYSFSNNKIDSLYILEKNYTSKDSNLVNIYRELCWELKEEYVDKAIDYGYKGVNLSKEIKWDEGLRKCYYSLGIAFQSKNSYKKSLKYFMLSLKYAKKLDDKIAIGDVYNNLGLIYEAIAKNSKALESYFIAIKNYRLTNNKNGMMITYGNIGNVYLSMSDYSKAEKYQELSLGLAENLKDQIGLIKARSNIALIMQHSGKIDTAIILFEELYEYSQKHVLEDRIVNAIYNNLGSSYLDKGEFDKALVLLLKAYNSNLKSGKYQNLALNCGNIGLVYYKKGKYSLAEKYLLEASLYAKKVSAFDVVVLAETFLTNVYREMNDYKKALEHHIYSTKISDSINNSEEQKLIAQKEAEFKIQAKTIKDSIQHYEQEKLSQEKINLQNEQINSNRIFIIAISLALVGIFFFLILYVRRLHETRKQKTIIEEREKEVNLQKSIIEEKHKEISDSIQYAERLQRSLMASAELLDQNFKNYFIYFNPKEAVSGDFYWAKALSTGDFILVCADSTGHGVPGAIMSMMNMNSLKEAIKEGVTQPNKILNRTREIIIETLANDGSLTGGKDGMDCSCLSFDFENKKLSFALANNPLWIIRNKEIIEFKPDKMPVGKHDKDQVPFNLNEFVLQKGDLIYTFTDGYADQFGGPKGKKFKYSNLQKIILENCSKDLIEQKKVLSEEFEKWRGDLEQVDDVCIIGVRI